VIDHSLIEFNSNIFKTMKKVMNKGFTLIELLVVIAIIGILAAIVLSALGDARGRAKHVSAKASISQVRAQAEIFYLDNGNSYGTGTGTTSNSAYSSSGASHLCTDADIERLAGAAVSEGATVSCRAAASTYTMSMSIPVGGNTLNFCVDSSGNATEAAPTTAGTVC
jgi:prepilin-type N-terminal cleavage/methylation domain-containing protein